MSDFFEETSYIPEVSPQAEVETPKPSGKKSTKKTSEPVKVKLANTTIYDGRYLVYRVDDISQVFLVSADHLKFSVSEQLIDEETLNASEKPYDWNTELDAIWPSRDAVRLAIYRNGLINPNDLQDRQKAEMALYGAFPNRFTGEK